MDPTFACVAKILKLSLPQFHHFAKQWDGSHRRLSQMLKELNISLNCHVELLIDVEKTIKQCQQKNIQILWPGHKYYPQGFYNIHQQPLFLTYWGDKELISLTSLSIVGAREPLHWIENWMEQELKEILSERGFVSVSGGARGVDQIVHRLSLRSGGSTVAILPSGVLNLYPKNLKNYMSFLDSGNLGLMSEYFPWEPMRKHYFFARNRMISAWSPLLFVVQASKKSGSMITACHAMDQGRTICTLPGSPMESSMHGNLQLLFDGAQMVRWNSDLLSLIPTQSHQPKRHW